MDPRYMDFGEVDFSSFHPTIQNEKKKKKVEPDLFRLVNVLGFGNCLVRGRAF